jgi:hypothetical protein
LFKKNIDIKKKVLFYDAFNKVKVVAMYKKLSMQEKDKSEEQNHLY